MTSLQSSRWAVDAMVGKVRKAEFAENSELTATSLPSRALRPTFFGGNAGEPSASGQTLAANWNSELTLRLSEFFRRNSEFDTRASQAEPASERLAQAARRTLPPHAP